LLATKLDASRVLGFVSFDCHPRSPFFLTSKTRAVIARLCLLLTPLALSPQKATPVPTTTHSLPPQKVTRSICVLRCPHRPVRSPPPAARALRITLNFSESWRCSRPASRVCDGEMGQSGPRPCRPPRCHRGCDAASDPPPPRRKSSSR
jgi:hypothetical protein